METIDESLPQGDKKRTAVRSMFDTIAPRYDLVNRLMTFRMDVGWRRKATDSLDLTPNSVVLDLACGTGDFCVSLAKDGHSPIGVDLSYGMLAAARTAEPLLQGDLIQMALRDDAADAAVCGFALRNLVELPAFFEELARVVKPGGRIALLDVSAPDNRLLATGHKFYFNKAVPKIGAILSDKQAYAYLPKSVSYLPEPAVMKQMLRDCGFADVERSQLSGGLSQLITARTSQI